MEPADISAVVDGFAAAARLAVASGLDGVEVNAGQHSLVRQFLSGLTNQRDDEWGTDKLRFATSVLRAVRDAVGDAVVGLRLSCDELAPWAGITPEAAPEIAGALAEHVDYVTVVKGSIFSVSATRPDGHVEPGFNIDLARSLRAGVARAGAGVRPGFDRRRGPSGVGRGRRGVRRGRDDASADRRSRPRREGGRGRGRPHPAVHPVQPVVPGPRRAQPDRVVRGGAAQRPRVGGRRGRREGGVDRRRARRRRRRGRPRVRACGGGPRAPRHRRRPIGERRRHGRRRLSRRGPWPARRDHRMARGGVHAARGEGRDGTGGHRRRRRRVRRRRGVVHRVTPGHPEL